MSILTFILILELIGPKGRPASTSLDRAAEQNRPMMVNIIF